MNLKKIFTTLILSFSVFLVFIFSSQVNAVTEISKTSPQEEITTTIKFYQTLGQALYSITWPFLVIAGKFLTNEIVYGSFLGMDTHLRKLWNIMRVFANYIIGFLLIFSIFSLFLGGKLQKYNPSKVFPSLFVGALLVNMSWFLIALLISLSNIATYAIGYLPLSISKKFKDLSIQHPKVGIKFQSTKNSAVEVGIVDSNGDIIPFCTKITYTGGKLHINPGKKIENDNETYKTCAYFCNGKYYKVSTKVSFSPEKCPSGNKVHEIVARKIEIDQIKDNPLVVLYASLLDVGRLATFSHGNAGIMLTEVLMKTIFLLALLIPLLVLAIILVVRVVILWGYIVLSPFIFLFTPLKDIGSKLLKDRWKLSEVCCVIFMPVYVVFALSLSIIFLHSISFFEKDSGENVGFLKHLGIEKCENGNCVKIFPIKGKDEWAIEIYPKITENTSSSMLLNFSALDQFFVVIIKWIFGIGFMWIVVFTALKSCKVTQRIASSVQKFSQDMLMSTPIIPVAGGQSVGSLMQGLSRALQVPASKQQEQFARTIRPLLDEGSKRVTGEEKASIELVSKQATERLKTDRIESSVNSTINNFDRTIKKEDYWKNLLNTRISQLDAEQKRKLASLLGVSEDFFSTYYKGKDITVSSLLKGNLKDNLIKYKEKEELKQIFKEALNKSITLAQLEDDAKRKINEITKKLFGIEIYKGDSLDKEKAAEVLITKLCFDKEDTMKLIADNLLNDEIPESEKEKLREIVRKYQKGKDCGK